MLREIELFESPDPNLSDFCLRGWMNSKVYKTNVVIRDELLARNLDAADRIKRREDQLKQKKNAKFTHDLQSSQKLTVGFTYICCEGITNLFSKH